jgi:hypothetical protein
MFQQKNPIHQNSKAVRGVGIFWRCASKILLAQVFCWRI